MKKIIGIVCAVVLGIWFSTSLAQAESYSAGDLVQVTSAKPVAGDGLWLNSSCGGGRIVGQEHYQGDKGYVVEVGGNCSGNGIKWLKVRWPDGTGGWSGANGPDGRLWLSKWTKSPSTLFASGTSVSVKSGTGGLWLRSTPTSLNKIKTIEEGTAGTIIGGPIYGIGSGGRNFSYFWKVDFGGGDIGWGGEASIERNSSANVSIESNLGGAPYFEEASEISIYSGQSISFRARNAVGGKTYTWDFGDGTAVVSGQTATHRFAGKSGESITFTIKLLENGVAKDTLPVTIVPLVKDMALSIDNAIVQTTARYNWVGFYPDGQDKYIITSISSGSQDFVGFVRFILWRDGYDSTGWLNWKVAQPDVVQPVTFEKVSASYGNQTFIGAPVHASDLLVVDTYGFDYNDEIEDRFRSSVLKITTGMTAAVESAKSIVGAVTRIKSGAVNFVPEDTTQVENSLSLLIKDFLNKNRPTIDDLITNIVTSMRLVGFSPLSGSGYLGGSVGDLGPISEIISDPGEYLSNLLQAEITANPPPLPEVTNGTNNSIFRGTTISKTGVNVNYKQTISVKFENTGTATWTNAAGYQLRPYNPPAGWVLPNVTMPTTGVKPGAREETPLELIAPAKAGVYKLSWRMFKDGEGWFGPASSITTMTVFPVDAKTVSFDPIIRVGAPVQVINRDKAWSDGLYLYSAKCGSSVVAKKFNGFQMSVISGPYTCSGSNIRWWEIRSSDVANPTEWVKDGAGNDPWLEIYSNATPSTKFVSGNLVKVTNVSSSLTKYLMEKVPELNQTSLLSLNQTGMVIDGPYYGATRYGTAGMYWFWRIDFDNGAIGWVHENSISVN